MTGRIDKEIDLHNMHSIPAYVPFIGIARIFSVIFS